MSYSITEIKLAAYNNNELPGMDVEERSLWYSIGFWYEEYRSGRESLEACEKASDWYIRHFVSIKRKDEDYDLRFR